MSWVIVNCETDNEIWYFDMKRKKKDWKKYLKYLKIIFTLIK